MENTQLLPDEIENVNVFEADGNPGRIVQLLKRNCVVTSVKTAETQSVKRDKSIAIDNLRLVEPSECLLDEIEDNCFDVIICGGRDEHSLIEYQAESFRMLRPSGKFFVISSSVSRDYWLDNLSDAGFLADLEYPESVAILVRKPENVQPGIPVRSILRTDRLYMRPWNRQDIDLEDYWPDFVDPIYRHYNPPRDPEIARDKRFERMYPLFDLRLSIFDDEGLAGYIALFATDMETLQSEMGIQFAAHKISRGYCKESLRALCDQFFYNWGMKRMKLEVSAFNDYGIRCYQKSGFQEKIRFWHPRAPQRFCNYENHPRLADKKEYFRKGENGVEVYFIGMAVTSEEYFELFNNPKT